jgi:tetratricopeptide (TPR) repeat protein
MRPRLTLLMHERSRHARARRCGSLALACALLIALALAAGPRAWAQALAGDPGAADSAVANPVVVAAAAPGAPASAPAQPHAMSSTPARAPAARFIVPDVAPPRDLSHVGEWNAFRNARHLAALPVESRIFYRRGLLAHEAGRAEEAMVDVRGATELDPTFVPPHLTLAAWLATREPSQALAQLAAIVELARQDFNLQLALAANATLVGLEALYTGLLLACLMILWLRREALVHAWRERLAPAMGTAAAHAWAIGVFALPFFAGFGLTLPAFALLGYLWPALRPSERAATSLLLAMTLVTPFALAAVERFSLPLHGDAAPFYDVPRLENAPYSAEREARMSALAKQNPQNDLLQFGHAWVARRGGHLAVSEAAYRELLRRWPRDDRAMTNLGNVLAMQGRVDEALETYQKAIGINAGNAAAWFNSAQLHTQRFEYQAATDALARASALDFELVRRYQSQSNTDGLLPLIDQWLQPHMMWATLRSTPNPRDGAGAAPFRLRRRLEASGWWFCAFSVLALLAGLAIGMRQHKRLHLRLCSNCGETVCRRCSERRREQALCTHCAMAQASANTPDQGLLLLKAHRRHRLRRLGWVERVLAALVPGFGLLSQRRVFAGTLAVTLCWLLLMGWLGTPPPFSLEPRFVRAGDDVPPVLLAVTFGLVHLIAFAAYLRAAAVTRARDEEQHQSAMGGRITQATRRVLDDAA